MKHLNNVRSKKGKIAAVFTLKEDIVGSKKQSQEPASIIDPVTKEIIMNRQK